ncbi:MAG: aminotransferase class I/II-fold pyridoxal phosphate-dependent enzyme [Lachnospiraceae bacterium]|nr:aminotransferase class I/II-fold pyridoxal phosphate-dependent enzyme [Lachnospiraceae bacterium]
MIHGGDIYNNKVNMDFSVSVNPMGMPSTVKDALIESVKDCSRYPEIDSKRLCEKCAEEFRIYPKNVLFGNGSSELFMAIAHAYKPKKVLIPVPSFYGYEHAFSSSSNEVVYYPMKEQNDFSLDEDFLDHIDSEYDFLILANPNNPTGHLIDRLLMEDIMDECKEKNIRVILDESFIDFSDAKRSFVTRIDEYPNLCIIRSFTKIFAIPSVRLGYMICSDTGFIENVRKHIPEWNVSGPAQAVGEKCFDCKDFISESIAYIDKEKAYLKNELEKLGIKVYDSDCNYLMIRTDILLYDYLLLEKILIRNCENFRGLCKGFYRIAVKKHEENEMLVNTLNKFDVWN